MPTIVRIAICQLESHPAIYAGQQMWIEEPFIPDNKKHTLSNLSIQGFHVDPLLEYCRAEYIDWQVNRIEGIFKLLKSIEPKPHIVLFPEGSIPYQCLHSVHSYSVADNNTVFAGTHSFQATKDAKDKYMDIGVSDKTIKRLASGKSYTKIGILPIFVGKRVHLVTKMITSPFEATDIEPFQAPAQQYVPFKLPVYEESISVLPLICSEALNFPKLKIKGDYDLSVIISCDRTPEHFIAVIKTLVGNKTAVAYCNDGRFGGSSLAIPIDERRPLWWFNSQLKGQLPPGDAVLVADIDFKSLSTEVGVTDPSRNFKLIKLCSITYGDDPTSCAVSMEMANIREIKDNFSRYKTIERLMDSKKANDLQAARIAFLGQLARDGRDSEDWWDTIGTDWTIKLPSLMQVEQKLSRYCYNQLADELLDYDQTGQGINDLRGFLKKTKELGDTQKSKTEAAQYESAAAKLIIDRDEDAKSTLSFLDDPRQKIAQILGLQQIGKSAVIEKALSQCGYSKIKQISIHDSPSAEYLILSFLLTPKIPSEEKLESLVRMTTEQDFVDALDKVNVLWVHNSERMLQFHDWRTGEISEVIQKLAKASMKTRAKVIFETRRFLPINLEDATICYRKRIQGMERQLKSHGVSFLDYQIRRVGLSPHEYPIHTKEDIVEKLGGHPVAIALCANALHDEGISSVQESLEKRKGFYLSFIRGLLRNIALSDEERMILRLLSGCRMPIPRETVLKTFDTPVAPSTRNLIDLCLIEVDSTSHIRLPGLLSSFFDIEEAPPDLRKRFHSACAESYTELFEKNQSKIDYAIEADFHAMLAGGEPQLAGKLVDSQMAVAQKFYDSQKFKSAKNILDRILSIKRNDDIMRLSALTDAKCNDFNGALSKAETVFKSNPRETWLLSEISRIALSQGRDDITEKLLSIAKAANMEDTSILIVSGRMLLRRGDLNGAKEEFERALKLTRRNAWPFYFLGKTHLRLGRPDKAIDVLFEGETFIYDKEIQNERLLAAIRTQLGIAYLLSDEMELAEKTLEGLYYDRSEDPEVIRAYSLLSLKKEGVDKAHEAFRKLAEARIRSRYDRSQYHLFYGIFYLWIGEKGKASEEFSRAHKEDKNNVYIMMKLAKTYYEMAMESWIDGEVEIAQQYAKDCGTIAKKILEFDEDNEVANDLQLRLYDRFEIEFSKI